jgi:hypothetical protein
MMTNDNELLDQVIERLYRIRRKLGPVVFRAAASSAQLAIARTVLEAAEKGAHHSDTWSARIIRFPLNRRNRKGGMDCDNAS